MAIGKIKHVFPGGNTPQGFFSYYDNIISTDATRIFILKGGPGVGKSTFMKKVGDEILQRGYDVEFHHCSSDNNSLDGLTIPALKIAFLDGTAPHNVDPRHPGCVDEILNLGEFWNESKLVKNKQQILECTQNISKTFRRAYHLLRAAKAIYDDWEIANSEAMDYSIANNKTSELITTIFNNVNTIGAGKIRKLFASAITPDGAVNHIESIVSTMHKLYIVTGAPGTGKATLLQAVANTALMKGLDVEAYYCPLDPQKLEHLLIPSLSVAIITSTPPHMYFKDATIFIAMNECLNSNVLDKYEKIINYDKKTFWELFNKAIFYLNSAKKLHDDLETYYVPNMNFDGVQNLWKKTLERVLAYATENDNSENFNNQL